MTTPPINVPRADQAESDFDPLRLCIFTTIALIAWIVTPPLAVVVFGAIGLTGYWKARRAGLLKSRCLLGDTRLVMVYLGLAVAVGAVFTTIRIADLIG